jgi:uncharacterized protein
MLPARAHIVTLGVADLAASRAFYERLGWPVSPASNENIVWFSLDGTKLGLFPADALAADAGVPAENKPGFRGVTLAINLGSREEVDAAFAHALKAGASEVKQPTEAEWGGYSGYFADPDGHLWELAHNPFTGFEPDGSLQM